MPATSPDILNSGRTFIRAADDASPGAGYVVAHCSDPHITCVEHSRIRDFLNKRLLGCLRWQLKRRHEQHDGLLTILYKDLQRTQPDHIVITGDLTHLSLPAEFAVGPGLAADDRAHPSRSPSFPATMTSMSGLHGSNRLPSGCPTCRAIRSPPQTAAAVTSLEELFPTLRIRSAYCPDRHKHGPAERTASGHGQQSARGSWKSWR